LEVVALSWGILGIAVDLWDLLGITRVYIVYSWGKYREKNNVGIHGLLKKEAL